MLDRLRPTATGLDAQRAWFLKLGAAVFCKPITLSSSGHLQVDVWLIAWWGFASPSERQWIEALIHCSKCSRFKLPDLPSFADLWSEANDSMFNSILYNSHHILHHLLPLSSQVTQHYFLRSRRHNLQLSIGPTSLTDRNFLHRMLYTDSRQTSNPSTKSTFLPHT